MTSARFLVCVLVACSHAAAPAPSAPPAARAPAPVARRAVTLSIVGTNDLHGAIDRLPLLAGFVANLRAARAADGGAVVVVDGGDMFQGTLESNLGEGADIVKAYNAIGYAAAAVGNHEFDYGPVGPAVTVKSADEDARGALKARASEAKFPFVVSNIADAATGARIAWPNMPASTLVDAGPIKVGIIGASTQSTPYTTMPANFVGLKMLPSAPAIAAEAQALRARGAEVIVATMHIGSECKKFDDPDDASSCKRDEEVFALLDALPRGAVDVIVGGHTHAGMAHRINGVAVIEAYSSGRAFGRVDVTVGGDGKVTATRIDRPRFMCEVDKNFNPVPVSDCKPGDYEGKPVVPDPGVQQLVDVASARAAERRKEKLGVTLSAIITRAHTTESAEGNFLTDLMLAARPDAQLALTNGGGLRADMPPGELTYGALFAAVPFDNRFAIVELTGKDVRKMVRANLTHGGAFMSWAGLTVKARCNGDALDLQISIAGKPLADGARYKLVTSDFLATGGDGIIGRLKLPDGAVHPTDTIMRDAFADVLRAWKGTRATIDPARLLIAGKPRVDYPGSRPIACGKTEPSKEPAE